MPRRRGLVHRPVFTPGAPVRRGRRIQNGRPTTTSEERSIVFTRRLDLPAGLTEQLDDLEKQLHHGDPPPSRLDSMPYFASVGRFALGALRFALLLLDDCRSHRNEVRRRPADRRGNQGNQECAVARRTYSVGSLTRIPPTTRLSAASVASTTDCGVSCATTLDPVSTFSCRWASMESVTTTTR